jgi:hypothetical protein
MRWPAALVLVVASAVLGCGGDTGFILDTSPDATVPRGDCVTSTGLGDEIIIICDDLGVTTTSTTASTHP